LAWSGDWQHLALSLHVSSELPQLLCHDYSSTNTAMHVIDALTTPMAKFMLLLLFIGRSALFALVLKITRSLYVISSSRQNCIYPGIFKAELLA